MMHLRSPESLFFATLLSLCACSGAADDDAPDDTGHADATHDAGDHDPDGSDDDTNTGAGDDATEGPDAATSGDPGSSTGGSDGNPDDDGSDDGSALACTDQLILDLGLVDGIVSAGEVANSADGDGWISTIDATAGGITDASTNPWIYLRFTDDGLRKVDLDDLQALRSTEWDIAAKRFGLRLNSGVSGPSTVSAAALADTAYEDVTELPASATLVQESFYDGDCTLIDDGSGQGAPSYALTPWWFYPGCVGTTLVPFVLELADGNHVKLVVDAYYESGQAECNEGGAMGTTSAMYTWRWAQLP